MGLVGLHSSFLRRYVFHCRHQVVRRLMMQCPCDACDDIDMRVLTGVYLDVTSRYETISLCTATYELSRHEFVNFLCERGDFVLICVCVYISSSASFTLSRAWLAMAPITYLVSGDLLKGYHLR